MEDLRWCAARIDANCFHTAMAHLAQQNFEAFMPMVQHRVVRRNKVHNVERPLFSGYAFTHLDLDDWRWRRVNSTRGVIHLLPMHSETPQPLPDGFIEALRQTNFAEEAGEVVRTFAVDQLVRILAGALRERTGRVIWSRRRNTRIALESGPLATLPTAHLEAVSD